MSDRRKVVCEVAWADPDCQRLVEVVLDDGASAVQAIEASGLCNEVTALTGIAIEALSVGVFGTRLTSPRCYPVKDGDRIEIYRPLQIDPMQARRARARRD
ncbi:RnfH family protein [Kushneria aurantia]|uniref:UPF0125 protein ACFFHW_14290 n=1 Tax=Kushneria aurantia TaxID=504092 RepID=A0ABV6G6I1_9GAMM|nr:RnfH family protein [Kushneria aurantia]